MTPDEREHQIAERAQHDRETQRRADRQRIIEVSGLSEELIDRVMREPIRPVTPSQRVMVRAAETWTTNYPSVPAGKGLAFTGPSGIYKSETMRRLAARLIHRDDPARIFYTFGPSVNQRLRAEYAGGDEWPSVRTMLLNYAEVVVICDVFKALPLDMRPWQMDFWSELFDQIDAEGRPLLCITANSPLAQIKASYDEAKAGWLADRIIDAVVEYQVDGPNGRRVHRG